MPVRMKESHRVRGTKRILILMANVAHFGTITCMYCHKPIAGYPHVDHIVSRASGGDAKSVANCVVACEVCNGRKCNRSVEETFGIEKRIEIEQYMATRLFSPDDLVRAREINRKYTKTFDILKNIQDSRNICG